MLWSAAPRSTGDQAATVAILKSEPPKRPMGPKILLCLTLRMLREPAEFAVDQEGTGKVTKGAHKAESKREGARKS